MIILCICLLKKVDSSGMQKYKLYVPKLLMLLYHIFQLQKKKEGIGHNDRGKC